MIDRNAFRAMSYGVYLISARYKGKAAGCVVNTLVQLTSNPVQLSVALNKENHTAQAIRQTEGFEAVVLSETATMDLIGSFGFHSSVDIDKFTAWDTEVSEQGICYVQEQACAHFSVKLIGEVDVGSHILFYGEVIQAEVLSDKPPLTYAYYHQVKGGKTPPKASSFNRGEALGVSKLPEGDTDGTVKAMSRIAWRCTLCGHIEYVDELPEDFICPICGVGKEMFECIEL